MSLKKNAKSRCIGLGALDQRLLVVLNWLVGSYTYRMPNFTKVASNLPDDPAGSVVRRFTQLFRTQSHHRIDASGP